MSGFRTVGTWVRRHIWGVILLVALAIVSHFVVKHFKRPGQMSVVEAQAMDMTAMKPPVGAAPVATEIASRGPFTARVRYTGSVAPENEQAIYPRVEGWLTDLEVYSGDRVREGQVLAVLDSPDIRTRLSEASYAETAASREVPVAEANLARMHAERSAARGGVEAAERDVDTAQARLTAAERSVDQAAEELKSARATSDYWQGEIERQTNLLKAGAVSQKEFDADRARATVAEAEVENKQARLEEAKANVAAARAEVRAKEAAVKVASDRVRAADAAISGAGSEVEQKTAGAQMAKAARDTAAAFDKYRLIEAPFAGVVTTRYLSPGVLVSPGTPIVNVAQIDRVRLQANVAEGDLGRVKLGADVVATTFKDSERSYHTRVSSIAPVANQTSRTAVVEAVVDNSDHCLAPGDFVAMEIAVGSSADALTVPSRALTTKDGQDAVWVARETSAKGKTMYTCTMHPEVLSEKPGDCPKCGMKLVPTAVTEGKRAHLVSVTPGLTDGERTEIRSGIEEGDEVIYAGYRYLREGDFVYPTTWGESGPTELPPPPAGAGGMAMPGHGGDGGGMKMDGMPKQDGGDTRMDHGKASGRRPGDEMARPSESSADKAKDKAQAQLYTCPMHPDFVTSDPKARCPECGMYVEKKKG